MRQCYLAGFRNPSWLRQTLLVLWHQITDSIAVDYLELPPTRSRRRNRTVHRMDSKCGRVSVRNKEWSCRHMILSRPQFRIRSITCATSKRAGNYWARCLLMSDHGVTAAAQLAHWQFRMRASTSAGRVHNQRGIVRALEPHRAS